MKVREFDLLVLGGGNAIAAAIKLAQAGWQVALVEKDLLGGTCPNRGCIPSKLLLGYADVATHILESGRFHIASKLLEIDGTRLLKETMAATSGATDAKLEEALPKSLTLFRGTGRFVDGHTLQVGEEHLRAPRVLLATGARPRVPHLPGLSGTPYWTSDQVFEQEHLPASITIIGGGYIGCELAHFFQGVGVETLLLNRSQTLLPAEDQEVREVFMQGFTKRVPVRFGTQAKSLRHDGKNFHLELASSNGEQGTHTTEALLFATGRVPNTDGIGLEAAGVTLDARGFVQVDDHLRTSAEGIHAMGDVKGRYMFTHAAAFEAGYLVDQLLGQDEKPLDYGPMPHAVFSMPEVAGVGQTEEALQKSGQAYLKASVRYSSAAKGRALKEEHGLCKFLLDPKGAILGCHVVGEHASVLLHEVIPAMKWRNHISSLTGIIHVHPSLSEVVRNAARKAAALLENPGTS